MSPLLADEPSLVVLASARSDVPRVIQAFDVLALPSESEGLALVAPEGMSESLPIVATNVGGLPTVVDHMQTGFFVEVDEDQLRVAQSMLVNDPTRAREMSARDRHLARARYSYERMVEEYLSLYEGARASSAPADRSRPSASSPPARGRADTSDAAAPSRAP